MEKGVIFLRSNLLELSNNKKSFPVRSFLVFCKHSGSSLTFAVIQPDNICKLWIIHSTPLAPLSFLQTSDWTELHIICTRAGSVTVRMKGQTVASVKSGYSKDEFKEFYIGGAPQDLREKYVAVSFVLWVRRSTFSHFVENNLTFCSSSQR